MGEDAVRTAALGGDQAGGVDRDRAGVARRAARAAADAGVRVLLERNRRTDRKSARAAAAADRLGEDAVGVCAEGGDAAGVGHADRARVTRRAAAAADLVGGRVVVRGEGAAHRESARAAAAADGLSLDPVGADALGIDGEARNQGCGAGVGRDHHRAGVVARAAVAADALGVGAALHGGRDRHGKPAAAAAAAH